MRISGSPTFDAKQQLCMGGKMPAMKGVKKVTQSQKLASQSIDST